jgi:hypothetical protein
MKIIIGMKCPDALERAIDKEVMSEVSDISDPDEREEAFHVLVDKCKKITEKWFEYGEYIQIIIDTEDETCVVKEL